MNTFAIYGCGGFGREILPLVRRSLTAGGEATPTPIVFVSDTPSEVGTSVNGALVISYADLLRDEHRDRRVLVSLGEPKHRRRIVERVAADGFSFGSVFAPSYGQLDDVQVGEGAVFCDASMCTSNIRIGKHFHCNIYSYVAHDCTIGDYVTFAPRVSCNGRITIGDGAYIGTGAVLRQGDPDRHLVIGAGSIIGMGAVVTKDVPPNTTVIGNPARPMPPKAASHAG